MNITFPLTIYYDASCRLCDSEMRHIKIHDTQNQLILVDCSNTDFDESRFLSQGITKTAMMNRLHAQDVNGEWLIGVSAFEVIYQAVGLNLLAKLWGGSITRPWAEQLYPWVVKYRYILSAIGLPRLINLWSHQAAKKAEQRSRLCSKGRCDIKD